MALLRRALASIALVSAGYLLALILIPPPGNGWIPSSLLTRGQESSALPCEKQRWPNADRACLTWTAPRDADVVVDWRQP